MKDIILPSETSDAIDLGAIDDNTEGIVISYKGNDAVGYITYTCGEAVPWAFFNSMDNTMIVKNAQGGDYADESLTDLVKWLIILNSLISQQIQITIIQINYLQILKN